MANKKRFKFFVPSLCEQFRKMNFESCEEKKIDSSRENERKLRDNSRLRERALKKELDSSRKKERKLQDELNDSKLRECELQKELDSSRENERKLREERDNSNLRERDLQKELDVLRLRKPEESSIMDDVEDGGAGIENEDQISGATPVRRRSIEIPPNLSENRPV